jgi:hypothetical protein
MSPPKCRLVHLNATGKIVFFGIVDKDADTHWIPRGMVAVASRCFAPAFVGSGAHTRDACPVFSQGAEFAEELHGGQCSMSHIDRVPDSGRSWMSSRSFQQVEQRRVARVDAGALCLPLVSLGMFAATAIVALIMALALAGPAHAQDHHQDQAPPQSLYLKASALIREGDYATARTLLERILHDFPADEIALKADERLTAILGQAQAQAKERTFASGPGLYVFWKGGRTEALPAFLLTNNNVGAETNDKDLGFMRCLSERTPYRTIVLTDVDRLVLYTPATDPTVFRLERLTTWFPYHYARDLAPLACGSREPDKYDLDLAQFAAVPLDDGDYSLEGSNAHRCGVSAPTELGGNATLLSQATGSWGKQPGPVVRAIWPFDILLDHREDLQRSPRATPQANIDAARSRQADHPGDLSLDLFIAEQYAATSDLAGFTAAVSTYANHASEQADRRHQERATQLDGRARAVAALRGYVVAMSTLTPSDALTDELGSYAQGYGFPVAYHLLSLLQRQAGDLAAAERSADKAVDAVSDKAPLLWYCGLVDTAATTPKEAAKAAKALCKANREEIKALRKQQRK